MVIVSLTRANSYETEALRASVSQLLEPLGGLETIVKRGDRVLLKPNLLTGSSPTKECVTRVELVGVVAQMVKDLGGHPFMGDSPAFGSARGVAKANGYLPILQKLEVPIVEFSGQAYATDSEDFNHLRLSKEAMEADVLINLPKVKSHVQLTITLGVKNLFGCVPGKMKAWWHLEAGKDARRFGQMLVETARLLAPDLTIADGIIGHEGNGPSNGEPRELGVLGASRDVFALDRALLEILNVDPAAVPTAAASQALGVCPELEAIEFPLYAPGDLQLSDWKIPQSLVPIDFSLPRIVGSTFKHAYVRWIKEPMGLYSSKV